MSGVVTLRLPESKILLLDAMRQHKRSLIETKPLVTQQDGKLRKLSEIEQKGSEYLLTSREARSLKVPKIKRESRIALHKKKIIVHPRKNDSSFFKIPLKKDAGSRSSIAVKSQIHFHPYFLFVV